MYADSRLEFEESQLAATRERLASLRDAVDRENKTAKQLRKSKRSIEEAMEQLQDEINRQRQKLAKAVEQYDEAAKIVEDRRERTRKTQKSLDKALKEIAACTDAIDKAASERYAIYRRCRLDEVDLPLIRGSLDDVPIDEVGQYNQGLLGLICQIGVDADAMDVDDEETQRTVQTRDFGIEPDFEVLEDEDREVSRYRDENIC